MSHTSHRFCDHEATATARATCRKARAALDHPRALVKDPELGGYVTRDHALLVRPLTDDEATELEAKYAIVKGASITATANTLTQAREIVTAA
jgi:hypothetical protein